MAKEFADALKGDEFYEFEDEIMKEKFKEAVKKEESKNKNSSIIKKEKQKERRIALRLHLLLLLHQDVVGMIK